MRDQSDRSIRVGGSVTNSTFNTGDSNAFSAIKELCSSLSSIEQLYVRQLENALYAKLPKSSQMQSLIMTLAQAIHLISTSQSPPQLEKPVLDSVMRSITGREIPVGNTLVSFGKDNQLGDVIINDVANGNIVKLNFNIYYE